MSQYNDYSAKDFALDGAFQKWVLSPDEQIHHFWDVFILNYPHKKSEIDEAIQLVQLSGLTTDQEANTAYLRIWGNVMANVERERAMRSRRKFPRYASWAATVAGILMAAFYLLRKGNEEGIEYKTAYAEKKEVVLEDGSTVMLNANSSLKLSNSWMEQNDREVFLQGEAFFNVVKTRDLKTFNVKTLEGITVQVLGTAFNINTRRKNLSVYLESGKVRLHSDSDLVILKPGERADYKRSLQKIKVSKELLAADKLAWKNNLYVMNDLSLSAVARDIEDNFGEQVIIMDSTLSTKRVTAKVPARDIKILLKVLSEALDIEIEQKNNQIIIRPPR